MFSVVIPLFNKAGFIDRCLNSVLRQTIFDIEVVVVDDGSTDDGPTRVAARRDNRVVLLRQANAGVSSARNRGVDAARRPFVALLDADDFWSPGYLEAITQLIDRHGSNCIYTTGYSLDYPHLRRLRRVGDLPELQSLVLIDYFRTLYSTNWGIHSSSIAIKKAHLVSLGGFPANVTHGEDSFVWDRAAATYRVAHCPQILSHYESAAPGQITSQPTPFGLPPTVHGMRALIGPNGSLPSKFLKPYLQKLTSRKLLNDYRRGWNGRLSDGDKRAFNWLYAADRARTPQSFLLANYLRHYLWSRLARTDQTREFETCED